jgi:hypothetical protein
MPKRVPFGTVRRPLDPRICNIGHDANALDRDGTAADLLVDRFCKLSDDGKITIVVAGGVRGEVQHPRTPGNVKAAVLPQIFNLRPSLSTSQTVERHKVRTILRGNARSGKHDADASHLSEAAEVGCAYFITHDKRILKKRDELHTALPPSLNIVTLAEFLAIYDDYEAGRRT